MSALRVSVLLDENCERQVISYIEKAGHSGEHVVDVLNPGVDDAEDIAPYAKSNDLVVLTKDTDFLQMDGNDHAGVFLSRITGDRPTKSLAQSSE